MEKILKTCLDKTEVDRLLSFGLDIDSDKMICADDLLQIVPWSTYIDKELCNINIAPDLIDEPIVIVSYERQSDRMSYETFTGETLVEALYEAVVYCHENNLIDEQYYETGKVAYNIKNDIILDGRIVSDVTFATRFKAFLERTDVNDLASEEELNYFKYVAEKLLQLQKNTIEDVNERKYFANLK